MDETRLMTLEEIEAWWVAHPDKLADPADPARCVIALPLQERLGSVEVYPHAAGGEAYVLLDPLAEEVRATLPLPDDLNRLAVRFDGLEGDGTYYGDTDSDDEDAGESRVCSQRIVELIRTVKGAR